MSESMSSSLDIISFYLDSLSLTRYAVPHQFWRMMERGIYYFEDVLYRYISNLM